MSWYAASKTISFQLLYRTFLNEPQPRSGNNFKIKHICKAFTQNEEIEGCDQMLIKYHCRRFKKTYVLLNLKARKISQFSTRFICQYMIKIFYVESYRHPLRFHTKYFAYTLKDVSFI